MSFWRIQPHGELGTAGGGRPLFTRVRGKEGTAGRALPSYVRTLVPSYLRAAVRGLWSAVAAALLLSACDSAGPEGFAPQYVVESYQLAGAPLAPVRLSRTAPLGATYDFTKLAVSKARVTVALLNDDGAVAARYPYAESADAPGVYLPVGEARRVRIEPLHTYRLTVTVPEGDGEAATLRSVTTVPDTFRIVEASADTVVYQSRRQLTLTLTPSRYPGRVQSYYIFSMRTRLADPAEADLTPLYAAILAEAGGGLEVDDFFTTTSPVVNASGYREQPDGTLVVEVPWLSVAFYGPNRVSVNVLDDNLYDFLRSQRVQQGGSTLAPGTVPNVIEHVEGGTGVFGSFARQDYSFYVRRP